MNKRKPTGSIQELKSEMKRLESEIRYHDNPFKVLDLILEQKDLKTKLEEAYKLLENK